jgi:tRNA-dihydrouridine synthase
MRELRKHAAWYFKGFPGAARLREAAVRLATLDDLIRLTGPFLNAEREK